MAAFDLGILVIRATGGEKSAFEEIYLNMWTWAFNFVMKHHGSTLSPEEARDVVQEAFLTAWENLTGLREPAAFRSWFFRILERKCLAARRLSVIKEILGDPNDSRFEALMLAMPQIADEISMAAGGGNPYRHLIREELLKATKTTLMRVYEKLTHKRQLVFIGRFVDLLEEREIERRTKLPIGTIRSSITEISRLLRKELSADDFRKAPIAERKLAFVEALDNWSEMDMPGANVV